MTKLVFSSIAACALLLAVAVHPAVADSPLGAAARGAREDIQKTLGFVPAFFKAFPDAALPGAWEEMKGLQLNPKTALSGKSKELVGLAVAAQVPCRYCTYAHVEFGKLNGASDAELGEAVALAGIERHWSAYFYGMQLDEVQLKADVARIVAHVKKGGSAAPVDVVDQKSALLDIERTLGFVPEFLRRVPAAALPGAWRELKQVKLSPSTSLGAKDKALISLAVASQVPSRACVLAETEFAKLAGASEQEIAEAVGMAAITRNMSTVLNGRLVDENRFRADVDRLVAGVKAAQKKVAVNKRH
jgi:AhpD family alkylhydroperoxidase